MKFKLTTTLIILLMLTGCGAFLNKKVNPYYFGMTKFDSEKLKKPKKVKIYDFSQENLRYFIEQGYKIKAKSAFRERYVDVSWAKLAAKQLGTPIMLLKTDYAGSVSGRRVLAFRIPGEKYIVTSNTNSNLNYRSNTNGYAVGTDGYAVGASSTYGSANYNSTTRTTIQAPDRYGYTTVPYENRYYDYFAVFLVKETAPSKKSAPKKYIKKSHLKYSSGTHLKKKPDYRSSTIKRVSKGEVIYVIKQKVSNSNYDKVFVNGQYGYILSKLIE